MQLFGFHSRVVYATSKSPSAFYISMCNAFSDRTFRRMLDGQEFRRGHRPLGVAASPASRQNLVAAGRVYSSFMWHSIMTRVTLVQRPGHFQRIFYFFRVSETRMQNLVFINDVGPRHIAGEKRPDKRILYLTNFFFSFNFFYMLVQFWFFIFDFFCFCESSNCIIQL